jgi:aminoglycoside phosphotransferase (APT) family kinase protein
VRIGEEHGLSGEAYRVAALTPGGVAVSCIVKREPADGLDRALTFYRSIGPHASGVIPACFGSVIGDHAQARWLVLEDIAPADQGDVLVDPGDDRARAALHALARIHAASWRNEHPAEVEALPRWEAAAWSPGRWTDRLRGARRRYPSVLTASWHARLVDLPQRVHAAIGRLRGGPACWIHGDAHLDNVLWRPDGSAVIVDWAGSAIGPPAVDVSRFLIEGPRGLAMDPARARSLIDAYEAELRRLGIAEAAAGGTRAGIQDALLVHAQGIVGWAGRPQSEPSTSRLAALRENALVNTLAWLDRTSGARSATWPA